MRGHPLYALLGFVAAVVTFTTVFFTPTSQSAPESEPLAKTLLADFTTASPLTPLPPRAALAAPPTPPAPSAPQPLFASVARFRDAATWCRANPFLRAWRDADFTAAAASLVKWRGAIVELTHELTWGAHLAEAATHKPYDALPPAQALAGCVRHGAGSGGKWICGGNAAQLAPGCVIYSVGSDGDLTFERDMIKATPCEIHTLDCTLTTAKTPARGEHARLHFHPLCIGNDDRPGSLYPSLGGIMAALGHGHVDIIKLDIEGFEFRVVESLFGAFLAQGTAAPLPFQLLVEVHYLTHTDLGWGRGGHPGLSSGDMAILHTNLAEMGYVLVHREDQGECGYCTELVFVRAFGGHAC